MALLDDEELLPFFGNPNIQRQGARARALAAQRDVNTLPDPRTYAALSGLLGTAPDEMGFSVLNPDYQGIQRTAKPAFALGTLLGLAPLTKGLPVGASIKNIKDTNNLMPNMLLYHGGDLVKNPTPYKQGLFTDGVPGVSFTPNIVEAARYAKHNMGSINAVDASGLKIYQGGEKALDAAYKAGDFSAIKGAGFDGVKLQNSSEYVLFDPEKVLSLPRKVAEQNTNRKVGGNMRQFLDWINVAP
jgi:hypothetical protein